MEGRQKNINSELYTQGKRECRQVCDFYILGKKVRYHTLITYYRLNYDNVIFTWQMARCRWYSEEL
jgi:hypothetical protein